jgi:hypothetical protein
MFKWMPTLSLRRLCPIFLVSNVTGQGLDLVRTFLNMLPSSEGDEDKFVREGPLEVSNSQIVIVLLSNFIHIHLVLHH